MHFFTLFIYILFVPSILTSTESDGRSKCEEITVPMCRGIGYNMTSMPNQFHHEKQDEAGMEAHQFWPLVEISCSDDLRFFLCSMYTPICMEDYTERLPVCRSVCERAQAGCAAIMLQYGFPWPESMDCNNFPVFGSQEQLCMDHKNGETPGPGTVSTQASIPSKPPPPHYPSTTFYSLSTAPTSTIYPTFNSSTKNVDITGSRCHCECKPPMISINVQSDYYNHINERGVIDCAQPCHTNLFFTKQEQSKSSLMITIAAFSCLLGSIMVIFTYLTGRERFCYPERSIIFLSACYLIVSIGFLYPKLTNSETIACDSDKLLYAGFGTPTWNCTFVFILIYFFSMAASLWWIILTFSWFLSASLKWTVEIINDYSIYFHFIAWSIPAVKSYLAITMKAIDGEPLAGICLVGNLNSQLLVRFIIAPLCAYLIVGVFFLLAGLFSILRIRKSIRKQIRQINDKCGLDKLMVRIIIFSILHIVPILVVIACNYYQYSHGSIWEPYHHCLCNPYRLETPYVTIHLVKYIMLLVPGITTCFWILSGKTLESWWNFLAQKFCCCLTIAPPNPRGQLIGSTSGGSSQYIVNSQRSYKQINHIAQLSASGQPHRKISLSHV
ncbi:frizzled-5 [Tetranychus urticae]|nr:frizzled-5 [Tetranychus urticae]